MLRKWLNTNGATKRIVTIDYSIEQWEPSEGIQSHRLLSDNPNASIRVTANSKWLFYYDSSSVRVKGLSLTSC